MSVYALACMSSESAEAPRLLEHGLPAGRPGFTAAQQDAFLLHIEAGLTRQEAAVRTGEEFAERGEPFHSTATRWRGFIFRDEPFRARYEEALVQGAKDPGREEVRSRIDGLEKLRLLERAFDEYVMRAMDPERGRSGSSNRALQNLLTLMHRTFKPFLEARVKHVHSGSVGLFAQPVLDTSKLSLEEQRELIELERRRVVLIQKATPDGDELDAGEIVEGEFDELPALPSPAEHSS